MSRPTPRQQRGSRDPELPGRSTEPLGRQEMKLLKTFWALSSKNKDLAINLLKALLKAQEQPLDGSGRLTSL